MATLLITLHVLVCISLIIIVLLQAGKGAEVGATFGAGASQTIFGATGSRDFLSKLTTAAAIISLYASTVDRATGPTPVSRHDGG